MATRIQNLALALGKAKQTNIFTLAGSPTYFRFTKIDADSTSPNLVTEDNAPEIGKGHEFSTQVFPVNYDVQNRIEKYASSEFCAWAIAYGLGNVTPGSGNYTIVPIDTTSTLELPYFPILEQLSEGGGLAADNLFMGCAVDEWSYQFNYGPGRQNSKMTVGWVGSGQGVGTGYGDTVSGGTMPGTITPEHLMGGGSLSLVVNGVDYVAAARSISGVCGWKNNFLSTGFYPGSNPSGWTKAQVRGRMEVGVRVPTFQYTIRMVHGSTEQATLTAQTTGTAVIGVTATSAEKIVFTWQKMAFRSVIQSVTDGLATVVVTGAPQFDSTNGILSVVATTAVTGIAA